mmetsp:Transcript_4464/g.7541  ORF Transcript_4464/g.7541 Transcript_4464/m.7541 type:complete len:217 (-) Transcript_4464:224-874(-)
MHERVAEELTFIKIMTLPHGHFFEESAFVFLVLLKCVSRQDCFFRHNILMKYRIIKCFAMMQRSSFSMLQEDLRRFKVISAFSHFFEQRLLLLGILFKSYQISQSLARHNILLKNGIVGSFEVVGIERGILVAFQEKSLLECDFACQVRMFALMELLHSCEERVSRECAFTKASRNTHHLQSLFGAANLFEQGISKSLQLLFGLPIMFVLVILLYS